MPDELEEIFRKNDMPELRFRGVVKPETANEKDRTIQVEYTTGARVFRPQYFDEDYYEELSTEKGAVRLGRMKSGAAPVLNSHRSWDLNDVLGTVIDADETHATLRLSDRPELEGFWKDIVNGIIRNISVGYRVYKYEDVTPDDDKIRVLRAIDWEPIEVSFVPIGADGGAGTRSHNSDTNQCVVLGAATLNRNEEKMAKDKKSGARVEDKNLKTRGEGDEIKKEDVIEEEQPASGEEEAPLGEDSPKEEERAETDAEKARAAERKRGIEIRDIVRSLDLDESLADDFIKRGDTVDQVRAAVIAKMAKRDEDTPTNSRVRAGGQDEVLTRREAIENAIMHRANPSGVELSDAGREYRGLSLIEIAREVVGVRECRGLSKMEIARRAFHSTSDFPEILANIANKSLRKAYGDTKRSFTPFSRQITLPDFKEVKRVALSNASSMEQVVEGGEYKRGTFSEEAETIQLMTYGKIIGITRQAIINDDLDAFTRVPQKMAATAARLENRMVYDILTSNPTMGDGTALFHADHGNLATPALAIAGIGEIRKLMRLQTDPSGEDILNYEPRYLIVPAALEVTAAQLKAQLTPNQTSQVNPLSNTFDIIVEGYLDGSSATHYYMAADPAEADTIEYAYLEGEQGPYLESRDGFDRDGLEIKVRHDFAAKAVDYRGLAKSDAST